MSKSNLTVIVPVHSVEDMGKYKFDDMFDIALSSISRNTTKPEKVLVVTCDCVEVTEKMNSIDFGRYEGLDVEVIINTGETDYQSQINFAAKEVKTEYMSVLEFDDELSKTWFKNVSEYIDAYPDIELFLPIINDVDEESNFVGLSNEAVWAYNFTETVGNVDLETLLEYPNISLCGMVIKTDVYNNIGGLKQIKLTFNYEFLLRFHKNGYKSMVIPKIGYKHVNMRDGSLFWLYKNSEALEYKIEPQEAAFWMETSKKEYLFNDDRNIIYEKDVIVE
jgi:GT2 family glycosyltransferase